MNRTTMTNTAIRPGDVDDATQDGLEDPWSDLPVQRGEERTKVPFASPPPPMQGAPSETREGRSVTVRSGPAERPDAAVDFAPTPADSAPPAVPSIPTGAGGVVPAHEVAAVDPKRQAQIATDLGQAREAIGRQGEAASGQALSEGATKANLSALLKKQADEAYKRIGENKGSYQEQLARLADVQNEAANAGIDPDRLTRNMTPAQRFMGALAAAASGAAAGWNRQTGNAYLESQERAKQSDIEAQKEGIQAKRQRAADFRAALADQAQQMEADNATIREAAGLERESVASQGEGAGAAFRAQLAQAASDEKAAMLGAQSGKELASMNRYSPGGRTGFDQTKLSTMAFEIMKADAANGVSTTPEQARARAFAVMTGNLANAGGLAPKPAAAGKGTPVVLTPPKSTEWDPRRGIQGTEAFANKEGQEQWNSGIEAALIGRGISPRAVKDIAAPYRVEPGMSKDTVAARVAAFQQSFGGGAADNGAPAPRRIVMRPITAPPGEADTDEP